MMGATESFWALLGFPQKSTRVKPPTSAGAIAETDSVHRIMGVLGHMNPAEARYLAAFAYMLSRVAHADRGVSNEEKAAMEQILRDKGGLTGEQASLVVEITRHQAELFGSTENFLVGREFDRIARREQKVGLLHCLYAVSAADQSISSPEDHEIRKITREIKLDHEDYISVRLAYRKDLEVLKRIPRAKLS